MEECTQITMEEYLGMKKEIRENITGIVKSFVTIGQTLTRIDQTRAYELDGYKSVTEMAKAEYGMTPGGVSRFLGVYKKFCSAGQIKDGYENYNYAQLVEMLNLPDEDVELITPETDRQDIRDLKRFNKDGQNDMHALETWKDQTPEEEENRELMAACLRTMFEKQSQSDYFDRVCQCVKAGEPTQKFAEELNPSGNRTVRSGRAMAFFYEKEVKLKVWSRSQPATMDYEWMREVFTGTFADTLEKSEDFWKWEYQREEMLREQEMEDHEETEELAGDTAGAAEPEDADVGGEPVQEAEPEKKPEIAPAQKEPEKKEEPEAVAQPDSKEEQIPGQDNVMYHPELLPEGMEPETTSAVIDGEQTHATVEPYREQRKEECLALVSMIQGNVGLENYAAALKQAKKLVEHLEELGGR